MTTLEKARIPAAMSLATPSTMNEAVRRSRLRVAVLEPDARLRSVLTRTLIRAGCVVVFQRTLEQVMATLAEAPVDAAIIALDQDLATAAVLERRKAAATRLIILSYRSPDPVLARRLSSVRFVRKPFDVRDLLCMLFDGESISVVE